MRIAIVTCYTSAIPLFRIDMIESFKELGHEVIVLGNEPLEDWKIYFTKYGVEYIPYDINRNGISLREDLRSYRQLRDILYDIKPDKLFTYLLKPNIYASLAVRKQTDIEVYNLITGLGSIIRGKGKKNSLLKRLIFLGSRHAYKNSVKVIFQNPDDRDLLIGQKVVREEQTEIINGSGVSTERFPYSRPPNNPIFLFVGRLIRDKGIREYIEASRRVKNNYPNAQFHIVGPLDSNPTSLTDTELKDIIGEGTIEYFGEQKDVLPFLNNCSVFVLPSYFEGTPRSVLEAMSVGRMIITTDAPGCRETVTEGLNGYLAEPRDAESLEQAMIKACKSSYLRSQMGEASRRIAENKYDVNVVNKNIMGLLNLY